MADSPLLTIPLGVDEALRLSMSDMSGLKSCRKLQLLANPRTKNEFAHAVRIFPIDNAL
jgi:hypothetical protein